MRWPALLTLLLLLGGCGGGPEPEPPPPGPGASASADPGPRSELDERMGEPTEEYLQNALADDPQRWQDATSGPAATLIYVTTQRAAGDRVEPMAIVVTSDPAHRQFQRRDSARVTVRRLKRERMGALLAELERDGLGRLPLTAEPYDQEIGPERALLLFREGSRGRVVKAGLDAPGQAVFTALERRLIRLTMPGTQ